MFPLVTGAEQPADLDKVRYAFRLGWAIAELRGRYRPARFDQRDPGHESVFARNGFELPLAAERSAAEIRRELVDTVEDLCRVVDFSDDDAKPSWEQLKASLIGYEKQSANHEALWTETAHEFYDLDADIQDALVLPATQAAAYQLGRGLAETYWALTPDAPADAMGSWEFVFGPARCATLKRLAARLSGYITAEVLASIAGPLESWSALGRDATRRDGAEVQAALFRQGLLWRDLIRGERSSQDLQLGGDAKASATVKVWKDLKLYETAFVSLRGPLIGGLVSVALLAGGGAFLASGSGSTFATTIAGILGALGLTSAGLYARAKAGVTSLLANLNQTVEIERVHRAADLCPGAAGSIA
jgi:hypothetical protein